MHFYKYGPGLGFRIKLYNRVPVVCGVRSRFVPKFKGRGKKKKGLRAKLSAEIEIKSSPESYFKRLKEELHHLPDAASGVHGVEVHEGDFKTHGSVKSWTYTLDGKKETFKERFEIDEANWSVSMVAVGGHILVRYKSYKIIHKVIPATTDEPPMVKVTLAYEKHQETDADPHKEMEFIITMMKDIDKHLLCQ